MVPPTAALAATAAADADTGAAQVQEVIVTAEKRTENIQHVAVSIEALDNRTLTQHQVNDFEDFVKLTPAVNFQTYGPGQTSIYMRGISSGGVENGGGPLPSVGTYLDEAPITTVAGTLDVHVYDIARIEVLPGPQGTLYGASSEAGTVRIITNRLQRRL
jgi:outer membrane cobalamin receptor